MTEKEFNDIYEKCTKGDKMKKKGITIEQAQKIRKARGLEENKLQKKRVEKGLSQAELSALSGISQRTISSYEQNLRNIKCAKLETLCSFCRALDCKIEDIIDDKELIIRFNKVK